MPLPDPANSSPPVVLSPAQAAAMLGVSRVTIYALIDRGDIRRYKVGRLTKIPRADLERLVGIGGGESDAFGADAI
jgi:excisionase family DNA binding protein